MLYGTQLQVQTVFDVYICSLHTSASCRLGILDDNVLYKSTHSLTQSNTGESELATVGASRDVATTHNLPFRARAAAVSGSQCRRACLWVPWHKPILRGAAYRQCVYAVGVTVTVAAVPITATVPRRPHKDGTKTVATLHSISSELLILTDRELQSKMHSLSPNEQWPDMVQLLVCF